MVGIPSRIPMAGNAYISKTGRSYLLRNSERGRYGYGSIPIDTFLVGWTSIYQLFWCSLGTRVLTHCHITEYFFIRKYPCRKEQGILRVFFCPVWFGPNQTNRPQSSTKSPFGDDSVPFRPLSLYQKKHAKILKLWGKYHHFLGYKRRVQR